MKNLLILTIAFTTSLLLINCEQNNESNKLISDTENVEFTNSNGLFLKNAANENSDFPDAKGNLDFKVDKNNIYGYTGFGFIINADLPINYAGYYLQVISETGDTENNELFNIPKKSIDGNSKSDILEIGKINPDYTRTQLRVRLDKEVYQNNFCILLSYYDNDGNISPSQKICINVLETFNNKSFLGNWNYIKSSYKIEGKPENIVFQNDTLCTVSIPHPDHPNFPNNNHKINPNDTFFKCESTNADFDYYQSAVCSKVIDKNYFNFSINSLSAASTTEQFVSFIINPKSTCKYLTEPSSQFNSWKKEGLWAFNNENQTLHFIQTDFYNRESTSDEFKKIGNFEIINDNTTFELLAYTEIIVYNVEKITSNEFITKGIGYINNKEIITIL